MTCTREVRYRDISIPRKHCRSDARDHPLVRVVIMLGRTDSPCRRTKPFPFYIYYEVKADTIYFLGLIHERRHPDFLLQLMAQHKQKRES